MRNIYVILILVIGVSTVLFPSCKKEDSDDISNFIKIDNQTYEIGVGLIQNYNSFEFTGNYLYSLSLYSKGINIVYKADTINSITGSGSGLYFALFSSTSDGISAGKYRYEWPNLSNNKTNTNTYYWGMFFKDMDSASETEGESFEINSGEINVENNHANYVIQFEGTTTDNKKVSVYYSGALPIYKGTDHN